MEEDTQNRIKHDLAKVKENVYKTMTRSKSPNKQAAEWEFPDHSQVRSKLMDTQNMQRDQERQRYLEKTCKQ